MQPQPALKGQGVHRRHQQLPIAQEDQSLAAKMQCRATHHLKPHDEEAGIGIDNCTEFDADHYEVPPLVQGWIAPQSPFRLHC